MKRPGPAAPHKSLDPGNDFPDLVALRQERRDLRDALFASPAFLASSLIAIYICVRLLSVAQGDPRIAVGIIANGTIASIAFAALVGAIPLALAIMGVHLGSGAIDAPTTSQRTIYRSAIVVIVAVLTNIAPWWNIALVLAPLGLFPIINRIFKAGPQPNSPPTADVMRYGLGVSEADWLALEHQPDHQLQAIRRELLSIPRNRFPSPYFEQRRRRLHVDYGQRYREVVGPLTHQTQWSLAIRRGAAMVILMSAFSSTFWQPTEHIEFVDKPTLVGYTLKQDALWTTILTDRPRDLVSFARPRFEIGWCVPIDLVETFGPEQLFNSLQGALPRHQTAQT